MRSAILNISLDESLGGAHMSVEQRYRMVMACFRLMFPGGCIGEIGTASYEGPNGPVQERCAIVQVELAGVARSVFEDGVRHISSQLGQDCIAVMYDSGEGCTVGPRADRWPFDPKFFNLPAVCRLQLQAA